MDCDRCDIPILGQQKQNPLIGATLEDVKQFGPILVLFFAGQLHAIFTPEMDPKNPEKSTGLRMTVAQGALPPLVATSLQPVLPIEAWPALQRVVLAQRQHHNIAGLTLKLTDGYELSLSLANGIQVSKDGQVLGPKVN
jgi:hypothetical protein